MQLLFDFGHHVQVSPILLVLVVVSALIGFLVRLLANVQQKRSIGYVVERLVFLKRLTSVVDRLERLVLRIANSRLAGCR
jgi:hypothetical protein